MLKIPENIAAAANYISAAEDETVPEIEAIMVQKAIAYAQIAQAQLLAEIYSKLRP